MVVEDILLVEGEDLAYVKVILKKLIWPSCNPILIANRQGKEMTRGVNMILVVTVQDPEVRYMPLRRGYQPQYRNV